MMARAHVFVFVIRRHDGEYFEGCGYGGPGHAVPYWTDEIRRAKQYTTEPGARNRPGSTGDTSGSRRRTPRAGRNGGSGSRWPGGRRWTSARRTLIRTTMRGTTDP